MKDNTPILDEPSVPLHVLRRAIENLADKEDDLPLSFTYIMTLCFPTVARNIQVWGQECYTSGYISGYQQANDSKGY